MVLLKCSECKQEFNAGADAMQKMTVKEDNQSESYKVLFFDCPSCGRKIFVQVDNEESLMCLERCSIKMAKIAALKKKQKLPHKKLLADFEKERKNLFRCRKEIQKRLTGKTVYNYAGESYEVDNYLSRFEDELN